MKILVLNSGSSSQKTCLYEIGETLPVDPPPCPWEGKIEWDGDDAAALIRNSRGLARQDRVKVSSRAHAMEHLLAALWTGEARAVVYPVPYEWFESGIRRYGFHGVNPDFSSLLRLQVRPRKQD